jgi:hypothetical protein
MFNTKLKRDQILPTLDLILRINLNPSEYSRMSRCHRLISVMLVRRYYMKQKPDCITCIFDDLPFSRETTRRAVRDGVRMGVIDQVSDPTDRRRKLVQASQKLIDTFESRHVES